ncbi:hypothetical protein [Herbiconiux liangxiaofengii]|uniref:hypothetical protein n=1 Tax=Herbiconiux liangxiaofengii TaxID=3342795 RepID=UPI0035BC5A4D
MAARSVELPLAVDQVIAVVSRATKAQHRFILQSIDEEGAVFLRRTNLAFRAERITLTFMARAHGVTAIEGSARSLDSLPGTDFGRGAKNLNVLLTGIREAADEVTDA